MKETKKTEEYSSEKLFLDVIVLAWKTFFMALKILWACKITALWALLAYCVYAAFNPNLVWLVVLLAVAVGIPSQTRFLAPFISDFQGVKKRIMLLRAKKRGNLFMRELGLVSMKDEEEYEVYLSLNKEKKEFTLDLLQPIPGISAQKVYDTALEQKNRLDAIRVVNELTEGAVQTIVFQTVDPLAGIRNIEAGEPTTKPRIGRLDNHENAVIDLAGNASHIIIQGQTRSGKSVLTQGLLAQIIGHEAIELWGIDPNRVLLEPVAQATNPKHFALGSDPEKAFELLQKLVEDMDKRLAELSQKRIEKFSTFDQETPLKVVVLEEYAGLIRALNDYDAMQKPADRIGARAKTLVGRLLAESAKVGYRVILIIQRADASLVDGSTRGQFATRITMGVDNADAVRMLHPNATQETAERVATFKNGRALIFQDRKEHELQADYLEYGDYLEICDGVKA